MGEPWSLVSASGGDDSEEELRQIFGDGAVISRVGRFNLVHLDNPSAAEIERRAREFDPDDLFDDDCPLCRMLREDGGNVVYDEY
jgi:hypothetical protein